MTDTTKIADGTYLLYPEGSAWIAARFAGGELVGTAEEANASTHDTAGDAWAGVASDPIGAELSAADAEPIIRAVMGDGVCLEMIIVCRAGSA